MRKSKIVKNLTIVTILTLALTLPGIKLFDTPIIGVDIAVAFWSTSGNSEKSVDIKSLVKDVKPKDKLITYNDKVTVQTKNGEKRIVKLEKTGKNSIVVGLKLKNGKKVKLLRRILLLPQFKDVKTDHWAKKRIELCVTSGLIDKGRSAYFRPEETMSKEKFAKMLAEAVGVKPVAPKTQVAQDVPLSHKYAKYINYAVKTRRLMALDANGNFRPDEKITRGEAIATFCRFEGLTENWDMSLSPFEDLPPRHKYARYISAAKNAGLLKFAEKRGIIDADGLLTNAEFAYLLSKTTIGKKAIAELLNWKIGYGAEKEKEESVALSSIQ